MIPAILTSVAIMLASLSLAAAMRYGARERLIERAGPASSAAPARVVSSLRSIRPATLAVAATVPVAYLAAGPVPAVVAAVCVAVIPRALRRRRRRKAADVLEGQLAALVSGVAAAMRAGLSLSQSIRFAQRENEPPIRDELRAVTDREDLGVPLEAALARWSEQASSDDVRLVGNALRLRIGSGLPRVLDEVGRALRERRRLAREVRGLTVQARLSGTILGVLPIGFFGFLALTSRHDMAVAFGTPIGVAAIVAGLVLQAGGYFWIRRLVRVEVIG
jgi:tight adherence protein B